MNWSELTQDWAHWFARIKSRFPNLDDSSMAFVKLDRSRFEMYLADTHHITLEEAREELADFLYIETLARDLHQQDHTTSETSPKGSLHLRG